MSVHDQLRNALIVSCQAPAGSVLNDPGTMALMAIAAAEGGARGIRANGPDHIRAIKSAVPLPVIGLLKREVRDSSVYITSSFADAAVIAAAGADLIALDATLRPRPDGGTAAELIKRIVGDLGIPVVADVDCIEAADIAARAGAVLIATTLAGYTDTHEKPGGNLGPNIDLVREIVRGVDCPVIAEGRYHLPEQLVDAFRAGAFAVVVGEAITDPIAATRRFVRAIPE